MYMTQWKPDSASQQCDSCAKKFEFFRRRHHCRLCGGLFCHSCSNVFLPGEAIVLRWLEINGYEEVIKNMGLPDTAAAEKRPDMTMEKRLSPISDAGGVFPPATMTLQRVCVQCFEDVETSSNPLKKSPSREGCGGTLLDAARGGDYLARWKNQRDKHVSLVGGRERRVCVILLQDSGAGESGERTDLRELFHALEQLTSQAKAHATQGNPSSKDTTPSLGPSLSSASDLSGSEKNSFDASLGKKGATASTRMAQQSGRGFSLSTGTPTKYRKKIILQVPIPLSTPDPTARAPCTVTANLSVRMQLVGVTHRHGFDKALLQQHTIGTDAYIILVDGELVSTVDTTAIAGVGSGVGNGAPGPLITPQSGNPFPSPIVSFFPLSCDAPQEPVPEAMTPTIGAAYDRSCSGKLMESARGVWEAIGRYGGDIPICAVIDCTSCIGSKTTELGTAPNSAGGGSTQQTGGGVNLRCQKDKHQKSVPVETQAFALHKALLLISDEVIKREMLRRRG